MWCVSPWYNRTGWLGVKHQLTYLPMLASFLCGEFLLHVLSWLLFLSREFPSHIPCWLHFYLGSFSYTSRAGFISMRGVSLTHPKLATFLWGEFLLHIPCCFFYFIWGVSLTHLVLALFLSGEFLLYIPCLLYFSVGSFFYTSHAGYFFFFFLIWGVSLTHIVLASFLCQEFLSPIPYWLYVYLGSFSYIPCLLFFLGGGGRGGLSFSVGGFSCTSDAGFIFIWGVSLTHPVLASFLCGEFLLHILCWLFSSSFFISALT